MPMTMRTKTRRHNLLEQNWESMELGIYVVDRIMRYETGCWYPTIYLLDHRSLATDLEPPLRIE
jgi:hypothetical protein